MNSLDIQYVNLLKDILENGTTKKDRTGTGTISVFGRTIRHKMTNGFPLLTTKKMAWKGIVSELIWFLQGRTDLKYLLEHNNHIWVGDAYQAYLKACKKLDLETLSKEEFIERIKIDDEFSEEWGNLGPIYGKQWRNWEYEKMDFYDGREKEISNHEYKKIDQIQNLIKDLKNNGDSRRMIVSSWNVGEISEMTLPPCHYSFQCYTRELTWDEQVKWVMKNTDVEWENFYIVEEIAKKSTPKRAISLMWNQRSVDSCLGLPFNVASYGLLLTILGKITNMVPDELIGNLGDTHIYLDHVNGAKEQIERSSFSLPKLIINDDPFLDYDFGCYEKSDTPIDYLINDLQIDGFKLENYQSHGKIDFPLSN